MTASIKQYRRVEVLCCALAAVVALAWHPASGEAAHALASGSMQADAVVFRPGASEVVIASNACDTVLLAAEEASEFMGKALGCDVPIVRTPTPSRASLFLGRNEWAEAAGVTTNGLRRDGFRIRSTERGVFVVGVDDESVNAHRNRQRGGVWNQNFEHATVFGVYDFLERFAGVRFYFPGELGTVVPKAKRIEVPATDIEAAPDFSRSIVVRMATNN